jgi:O-antigen biosynthesis protein
VAVDRLVGALGAMGAALVVDIDDAFVAMDDHPEADHYRPLNAAIEHAIAASAETWFSTPALAELYGHVAHRSAVLRNALDPRIWRDWRNARPAPFGQDKVRMLYMGTGTHGPDFAAIRPALDRLWAEQEGRFDVTLIGIGSDIEPAPWLHRIAPPAEAIAYPRFVRWLRGQGPFDIGLAPLADTLFNSAKSDIKLLDYLALGLLPVVQDCAAYRLDPDAGAVAIHADDWFETLRGLIDDRASAQARLARGQSWLWEKRATATMASTMIARLDALL